MSPDFSESADDSRQPSLLGGVVSARHLLGGIAASVVVLLYMATPSGGLERLLLGNVLLLVAPLAAALVFYRAARHAPAAGRLPWLFFAAASLFPFAGQAVWASAQLGLIPSPGAIPLVLFLLFHPLFAAGAALALRPARVRGAAVEVALDGALLLAIAAAVVLRVVVEPLTEPGSVTQGTMLRFLAGPLASVASLFFAGLLLIWRHPALPARAVARLAAGAAVFAGTNFLVSLGLDPQPASAGDAFELLWLAGWALLIGAGAAGIPSSGAELGKRDPSALATILRRALVPGAALLLGAAAIDAAFHRSPKVETELALAVVGVLLALRLAYMIRAADRQTEERRQLAHTRALVEVSHALACTTDVDETLNLVAQWTTRLLHAKAAGIELLNGDGHTLEFRAAHGLPPEVIGMQFPVERSFTGWVIRNGRTRTTNDPADDPFIHPQSRSFLGNSPTAATPLRFRERLVGVLSCIRDEQYDADDLELLGALADQAAIAIENARLFEQVHQLSLTDPLTGLANRRQLERDLAREFAAARRGRRVVTVIFDLDGFKQYNDRYGHLAGDEALRSFARLLASETRAMNLAARYGGDEFVVLLSDSDLPGAEIFVDRVCMRFADDTMTYMADRLTVSAGLAAYSADMRAPHDLIAAADADLYAVKARRSST
jgi:diguanylate cyclase (GGDEF)-like protein